MPETTRIETALQTAYDAINLAERDPYQALPQIVRAVRWLAESVNELVQMEKRRG